MQTIPESAFLSWNAALARVRGQGAAFDSVEPEPSDPAADDAREHFERDSRALQASGWPAPCALRISETSARTTPLSGWFSVLGDASLLSGTGVALVGTRRVSQDACPWLPGFIRELIAGVGVTTVSGGALGVDSLVHAASLDVGIPTVVVVAGGLRHLGPRSNEALFRRVIERGGCIVSDKPLDRRPDAFHFVARNRVIAALSAATVVVRAPEESGALATAAYARRMGRPVLAVPGDPTDAQAFGCHRLIREGAGLCCGPSDVSDALGLRGVSSSQLSFGLTEESVPELGLQGGDEGGIQALLVETLGRGALSVDELCERTGQRADLVLSALTELELLGSVSMAGGLVCLPRRLFAGTRRSR